MKNVTISMDEGVLREVRLEAGRAGVSVSRWIAEQIDQHLKTRAGKVAASERIERLLAWLETPHFDLSENGKITIDRDELYDDGRFSRFDGPAVQPGSTVPSQAGAERQLAEDTPPFKQASDQSTGAE